MHFRIRIRMMFWENKFMYQVFHGWKLMFHILSQNSTSSLGEKFQNLKEKTTERFFRSISYEKVSYPPIYRRTKKLNLKNMGVVSFICFLEKYVGTSLQSKLSSLKVLTNIRWCPQSLSFHALIKKNVVSG